MQGSLGGYRLVRELGDGYSGSVVLAEGGCCGDAVALKFPSPEKLKKSPKIAEMLLREFEVLSRLSHPRVVRAVEFRERAALLRPKDRAASEVPLLALEHVPNGELLGLICAKGPLGEEAALHLFRQLMETLEYVHSSGFSHGDVKPENLLLDREWDLKLIDFAFSLPLGGAERSLTGTPGYIAPEMYPKKGYDPVKADVFAAGVVLFVTLRGMPPFDESHPHDPHYAALSKSPNRFWEYHKSKSPKAPCPTGFVDLVSKMLEQDPRKRISVKEVLAHPFLATPCDPERARRTLRAMKSS